MQRRRFKQTISPEERLAEDARRLREEARIASPWTCARCRSPQGPPNRDRLALERVAEIARSEAARIGTIARPARFFHPAVPPVGRLHL